MAACENDIHLGDIGTVFEATIKDCVNGVSSFVDLTGATFKEIIFKKPDGTKLTKAATFKTDGTDGIIQYTTIAGDLDQAGGSWKLQANLVLPSGSWRSSTYQFTVLDNL